MLPKNSDHVRYATVAVDAPVDAAYTYGVPEQWRRDIGVGSRVMVPLGKGNRLTAGTVLELLETLPEKVRQRGEAEREKQADSTEAELFGEDFSIGGGPEGAGDAGKQGRVKWIAEVQREVIPIPADLLELAKWISTYYVSPIGMTIASMVPAAVKRGTRLPVNVLVSLAAGAGAAGTAEEAIAAAGVESPKGRAAFAALHEILRDGEKTEQEVLSAGRFPGHA